MNKTEASVNAPISTSELERRWSAVRAAMRQSGIDVLLMQNNNDFMGGYVKYFTDLPATNGYPVTVVFPADERMTIVSQGPFGLDREIPEGDPIKRGVGRILGTPSYASADYTIAYDARLVDQALAKIRPMKVGLVGPGTLPYAMVDHLRANSLSSSTIVDASDLVDRIKSHKSEEELQFVRRTAALQDAAMSAVKAQARPGMRESQIAAIAEHACRLQGSEQGIFLCGSAPVGQGMFFDGRHFQNRVVEDGDYFALLIETNGPGGYYTELGRSFVFGKASEDMLGEHEFVLKAREFSLGLLRPGALGKDIWETYNAFMAHHGRPREERLYCHGQGYDMVERPLVRPDEPMPLHASMSLVCHPTYATPGTLAWICDNYLFNADHEPIRIHEFPEVIVEL